MKKKKSTTVNSLSLPTWTAENATILSTMEFVTNSEISNCDDPEQFTTYVVAQEQAWLYLEQRLSMSRKHVQLLSFLMLYSAKHPGVLCDSDDLAEMMKLHPLRMLQLVPELSQLEESGYVNACTTPRGDTGWRINSDAKNALIDDHVYDIKSSMLDSNIDFLSRANYYIKEGMRCDADGSIVKNLQLLMRLNKHLPVVQSLQALPESDRWFMLIMMTTLAIEEDEYVSMRDLEQILSGRTVRTITRQIRQKQHSFAQKDYVEQYAQDGMTQSNQWVLTDNAWVDMCGGQEEAQLVMPDDREQDSQMLTNYENLTPKQLFFSGRTKEQVERLYQLLQEEQYANVCQALKKRGMPTGLCCLFYGSPGTGKTELVQQLAIATKRDLLQVDLSCMRDKYVGESEKQIKRVFDRYRALVHTQERAPILFFNEADAIFGNRLENTQRAVDKMENAIQNIILQEMETLDGILICTTNLTSCLDKAFDRRFLFKMEFEKPTNEARKQIWKSLLEGLNEEQAAELADRFDFSGGQIQNISRKQVINAIFSGKDDIDYEQVKIDCQNETISRQNGRKIGF